MSLRSRSSVVRKCEEPPPVKKKKASLILPHTTISSLPDDLILICLARVSRLYYPILSLVSKKFQSLIASPELYEVRSLLGLTESYLYVSSWFLHEPSLRWFTLCRRPNNGTTKKKNLSGYLLVPIPTSHSVPVTSSSFFCNGTDIYAIGGMNDDVLSSNVSILDCRTHTWHQAPNMQVARAHALTYAIDGKICVAEGVHHFNSSHWLELLDPKTLTWESVSSLGGAGSTKIDETRYVLSESKFYSHCKVDNVKCYYSNGVFKWYENDSDVTVRGIIKGLIGLPKFYGSSDVQLVNYGGKMAVFWEKHDRCSFSKGRVIWCAVIAFERRSKEEIWGTVEWCDPLLKVPKSHTFLCVLATKL